MGRRHVWDSCFSRASDGMAVFSERGNRDQWHFDPHLHPRLGWPGLQGACLPPPRAETPRFQLPGVSARAPVWTPLGFTDIPRGPGKVIELPPPRPQGPLVREGSVRSALPSLAGGGDRPQPGSPGPRHPALSESAWGGASSPRPPPVTVGLFLTAPLQASYCP